MKPLILKLTTRNELTPDTVCELLELATSLQGSHLLQVELTLKQSDGSMIECTITDAFSIIEVILNNMPILTAESKSALLVLTHLESALRREDLKRLPKSIRPLATALNVYFTLVMPYSTDDSMVALAEIEEEERLTRIAETKRRMIDRRVGQQKNRPSSDGQKAAS